MVGKVNLVLSALQVSEFAPWGYLVFFPGKEPRSCNTES